MVAALEARGLLAQAIEYAADRTAAVESGLIRIGIPPMQAMELMRQEWAFLPSEQDVPHLPNGGPEPFALWICARVDGECRHSTP